MSRAVPNLFPNIIQRGVITLPFIAPTQKVDDDVPADIEDEEKKTEQNGGYNYSAAFRVIRSRNHKVE